MVTSHSYEKKWKYVSIGLMAVLAVGFSFPQAFAHVTSDMKHGVEHVIALLNAIKAKTDNLPADPASQSVSGKPTGSHLDIFEGQTTTIIPAPAAGFEKTAILTLSSNGDTIAIIGHKEGGGITFVQDSNLEANKAMTLVADVPAGKELVVDIADDGDAFTTTVRVTVIWWESAAG